MSGNISVGFFFQVSSEVVGFEFLSYIALVFNMGTVLMKFLFYLIFVFFMWEIINYFILRQGLPLYIILSVLELTT